MEDPTPTGVRQAGRDEPVDGEHVAPDVRDDAAMIDTLRRYRRVRAELDVQKRRAKEYVEQIKAEVEADLAPLEAHLDSLRSSMQNFIEGYNAGGKFKCAGLGTVYTSKGYTIGVSDEKALMGYVEGDLSGEYLERVFPRKLSVSAAKKLAQEQLDESGEQVPGVEVEPTTTLNVRLLKQPE